MNTSDPSPEVRRTIEKRLLAYTRGIDRLDTALIASAFHPEATMEGYGRPEPVTIEDFIAGSVPRLRQNYRATQHRLSNISMDRPGRHVQVESYVLAYHVSVHDDGPEQLTTFNGRYLDRFTERDGWWRIEHRLLRAVWTQVVDLDQTMERDWVVDTRDEISDDPVR